MLFHTCEIFQKYIGKPEGKEGGGGGYSEQPLVIYVCKIIHLRCLAWF